MVRTGSDADIETKTLVAAIDALRREAGVTGQSTQTVYVDSRHALYSRTGDLFAWSLVAFTALGFFLPFFNLRK